jgi:hypothetical protein
VINNEIAYFTKLGRGFEWKVYSHDQPADLLVHLRARGFRRIQESGINLARRLALNAPRRGALKIGRRFSAGICIPKRVPPPGGPGAI